MFGIYRKIVIFFYLDGLRNTVLNKNAKEICILVELYKLGPVKLFVDRVA